MKNYELIQISIKHKLTVEQVEKLIEHLQKEQPKRYSTPYQIPIARCVTQTRSTHKKTNRT